MQCWQIRSEANKELLESKEATASLFLTEKDMAEDKPARVPVRQPLTELMPST